MSLLLLAAPAFAQGSEAEAARHVGALRGIRTTDDQEALKALNQRMDAAWRYFEQNRAVAVPIIRREVAAEVDKPKRDSFFLLDLGYFLLLNDRPASAKLALAALDGVDPADEVVQWNFNQMYKFAALAATTSDPAILPFLDKAYLPNTQTLHEFVAPNLLQVSPDMLCAYLYGALGAAGERHLLQRLERGAPHGKRALEALNIMGSEAGVSAIVGYMRANRDRDTFIRAFGALMRTGGPRGRDALLALDLSGHDQGSRDEMAAVREQLPSVSFESIRQRYEKSGFPGPQRLADDVLRARLAKIYENYGYDNETNPVAVLNSTLPTEELIAELLRIRQRTFHGRPTNRMIETVKITTDLINALQYRKAR
jgi:hypothetical protein